MLWLFLLRWWSGDDYVGDDTPRKRWVAYGLDRLTTGVFSQLLGGLLIAAAGFPPVPAVFWLGVTIAGLGWAILIAGCLRHVRKKEFPTWVGVVLGLLSIPGALVALLLPSGRPSRRGFDVLAPRRVVDTWVTEDPTQAPRPWAEPEQMAELWRKGNKSRGER